MTLLWSLLCFVYIYCNVVTILFGQLRALMGCIFVVRSQRRSAVVTFLSSYHCQSSGWLTTSSKLHFGFLKEFMNVRKPILYCELLTTGLGCCKSITLIMGSLSPTTQTQTGGERILEWTRVGSLNAMKIYLPITGPDASGWSWNDDSIWMYSDSMFTSDTALLYLSCKRNAK